MTKRTKWTRVALPSGGSARVRSDVSPEFIKRLDELFQATMQKYMAGEIEAINQDWPTPEERRERARSFWGDSVAALGDNEQIGYRNIQSIITEKSQEFAECA